jgi:hypothetical protein
MLQRVLRTVAATVVATAGLVGVTTGSASAAPCPGGESPCVYLPGGVYTIGNPVPFSGGLAPSTTVLLKHCDSTGTRCDYTTLNLPGIWITSTPTSDITLTVPGEGVGLSGITPTLYLGVPSASRTGSSLGLTVTVSGTPFVLFDSVLAPLISCAVSVPIPPISPNLSGRVGCSFTFTVSL